MTVLTLQPDATAGKDTYIVVSLPTNNYGTTIAVQVGTQGGITRRALFYFDVSSLPSNAIISSALLTLRFSTESDVNSYNFSIYRALTDWYEGVKNSAPPSGGEDGSTWNLRNANGSVAWAGGAGGAAGSDWETTPTDTIAVTAALGTFFSWNVTADIQAFVNGTATNRGWWLRANGEINTSLKTFSTSDSATATNHPKLEITYVVPEGSIAGTSNATGVLRATGTLAGEASGIATVEGYAITNQNLLASVAGSSSVTAFLRAHTFIQGNSFGDSVVGADIKASYHSFGTSNGGTISVADIKGKFYLEGSSQGAGTLLATPSFQGQLRGNADGSAYAVAYGYAKAVHKTTPIGCNPVPLFYITDGTVKSNGQLNILNFLSERGGYLLKNYKPQVAQYKDGGRFSSSPQSQGRRLKSKVFDNAIDVLELTATALDQDALIQFQQDLISFQEAASDYWASEYALLPYYLVARAARETNIRYSVIHMISVPELENPYSQPFFNIQDAAFESLTVRIEHGLWLSTPPGKFDCVETSNLKQWTVSGWQAGV